MVLLKEPSRELDWHVWDEEMLGIDHKHFSYQAEDKIIPKTDQQVIKISSKILLDLGVAIRSTNLTVPYIIIALVSKFNFFIIHSFVNAFVYMLLVLILSHNYDMCIYLIH
jgi:hypothetical protein